MKKISKTFKVTMPKSWLRSADELIEEGIAESYAEVIRRGLRLFLEEEGKL